MIADKLDQIKIVPVLVLNTLEEGLQVCEQLCKMVCPLRKSLSVPLLLKASSAKLPSASPKCTSVPVPF